ncbi:hypothetical protein [Thiobacillus sp.]
MNEQLNTLEHAQQTAIVHAIPSGPRVIVTLPVLAAGSFNRMRALSDFSTRIAIRFWTTVSDFYATSGDVTQAVLETFREHGIQIPFPQREVRLLGAA